MEERNEKRPVNMPWKGLDRAIEGGCTNEEVKAMFPGEELTDEWLDERRDWLEVETPEKDAPVREAVQVPEYLRKLEDTIAEFADRIVEANELVQLIEAARGLEIAKMTNWETQTGMHRNGVPF